MLRRDGSEKIDPNSESNPTSTPLRVIEELEIGKQRHFGEHVLDEQRLAPAVMADDDIRLDALVAQFRTAQFGDGKAVAHGLVELADEGMAPAGSRGGF